MALASVDLTGLEQLRKQLADLPRHLESEAEGIVQAAAEATVAAAAREYRDVLQPPEETGQLARGGETKQLGPLAWIAYNRERHAHLFEFGTITRFLKGSGANRGRMPARPVWVPAAIAARARMVDQLKALVRRAGFEVA